jgi:nicotinamide-nucleotide amidase
VDEKRETPFISLPGVPYEMVLKMKSFKGGKRIRASYIIHKTILTYGQGESLSSEQMKTGKTVFRNF